MTVMTDVQAVAADTTTANILAGKADEFLQFASAIQVYLVASAVGLNATVMVGSRVMFEDQELSDANRFPLVPDDLTADGTGLAGERIIIRLRNTTAGALTCKSKVVVEPIA